ncbi:Uncharacterised protein [Pseudomonas mucidolens]|nr:Uncharacterised protein [Pseudomonas mucidolens]
MGERNVGKRIDGANVWPQLTAGYQCAQLIQLAAVLSGDNEVITGVLAPGLDEVLTDLNCLFSENKSAAQLKPSSHGAGRFSNLPRDLLCCSILFSKSGCHETLLFFVPIYHVINPESGSLQHDEAGRS